MAKIVYHWKDPGPLARLTLIAIAVSAVLNTAYAGADWYFRPDFGFEGEENLGRLYDMVSTVLALLTSVTLVPGCVWLYRVTANARSWNPRLAHSPASAWLWFLAPVAHFFMPFRVLSEVYRATGAPRRTALIGFWIVNVVSLTATYAYVAASARWAVTGYESIWPDIALTCVTLLPHPFFAWLVIDLTRAQQDSTRIADAFGEALQPA